METATATDAVTATVTGTGTDTASDADSVSVSVTDSATATVAWLRPTPPLPAADSVPTALESPPNDTPPSYSSGDLSTRYARSR
jgi:hypothetical protein